MCVKCQSLCCFNACEYYRLVSVMDWWTCLLFCSGPETCFLDFFFTRGKMMLLFDARRLMAPKRAQQEVKSQGVISGIGISC